MGFFSVGGREGKCITVRLVPERPSSVAALS